MKFVDEAKITVQSGHGGAGCVSFRREKYVPKGGPDGGDGGQGGDVIFVASEGRRTLAQFRFQRQLSAKNGQPGQGRNRAGRAGASLTIEVPCGTLVWDAESNELIHDLSTPDMPVVIASGGRGGQGNARFKSSTQRTPRFAQPGEPGEELQLRLELKLLADVGLVGLPNAGKSTLMSAISAARPKVGAYPFTTLTPSLGVVTTPWADPFVVADIPGLIEGAHEGAGLGIQFLRHIERTRLLVHLVDAAAIDPADPLAAYRTINAELAGYDPSLAAKPQIVVLTKSDLPEAAEGAALFKSAMDDPESILTVSAVAQTGLDPLLSMLVRRLDVDHEPITN